MRRTNPNGVVKPPRKLRPHRVLDEDQMTAWLAKKMRIRGGVAGLLGDAELDAVNPDALDDDGLDADGFDREALADARVAKHTKLLS